jgi:hypothetical protein
MVHAPGKLVKIRGRERHVIPTLGLTRCSEFEKERVELVHLKTITFMLPDQRLDLEELHSPASRRSCGVGKTAWSPPRGWLGAINMLVLHIVAGERRTLVL